VAVSDWRVSVREDHDFRPLDSSGSVRLRSDGTVSVK
jgi:hypothetical protein